MQLSPVAEPLPSSDAGRTRSSFSTLSGKEDGQPLLASSLPHLSLGWVISPLGRMCSLQLSQCANSISCGRETAFAGT